MSGDQYVIRNSQAIHFVTFTVIEWIDLFTRKELKLEIVDSLNYCVTNKGLVVYGWVIMPSHIHLLITAKVGAHLPSIIRDFKRHTARRSVELIDEINESRREWLVDKFRFAAKESHLYKVWQDGYHGVECDHTQILAQEKLDYIHNNPVTDMIVRNPEDYLFSSAYLYAGGDSYVQTSFL